MVGLSFRSSVLSSVKSSGSATIQETSEANLISLYHFTMENMKTVVVEEESSDAQLISLYHFTTEEMVNEAVESSSSAQLITSIDITVELAAPPVGPVLVSSSAQLITNIDIQTEV